MRTILEQEWQPRFPKLPSYTSVDVCYGAV